MEDRKVPEFGSFSIDRCEVACSTECMRPLESTEDQDRRGMEFFRAKIDIIDDCSDEGPRVILLDSSLEEGGECRNDVTLTLAGDQRLVDIEECLGGSTYMLHICQVSGFLTSLGSERMPRSVVMVRPLSPGAKAGLQGVMRAKSISKTKRTKDAFENRTDVSSSYLYFYYYGMLQHQQNMLQDHIRTGTYFAALTENAVDFRDKTVMDVGCGSGILSFFAAQAGARVVYAVEASSCAKYAELLVKTNPILGNKIRVLHGKVEEIELPEKVDILVSEPMGTLLVNERMLETYIYARDHHLRPGGIMFPTNGTMYLAAFSDEGLYNEISSKSSFWNHESFYGINLNVLSEEARQGYFSQPVVDQIPPQALVSNSVVHLIDFASVDHEDLVDFEIPLSLQVGRPCTVHGIASWFDVSFAGSTCHRVLSTSPGVPLTHWYQIRCVLMEPIRIDRPGETIKGTMRFRAHDRQSYDVFLQFLGPGGQVSSGHFDLKEPYYRQLVYPAAVANGSGDDMGSFHRSGGEHQVLPTEDTWWV
jgi:2-polyprenyl-3-methyl-5-hydroxy-6-metoxy-1,4-benzoquinol methylase